MNFFKKIKENKAATMTDVVVGILILILFTGILTSSFYQIYKHNISIRMNAIAVDYAIKILEDIDRIPYEEVTNDLNQTLAQDYDIKNNYQAKIDVTNYNKDDTTKEDIIKIVTVTIDYNVLKEKQSYTVQKLKIKER